MLLPARGAGFRQIVGEPFRGAPGRTPMASPGGLGLISKYLKYIECLCVSAVTDVWHRSCTYSQQVLE